MTDKNEKNAPPEPSVREHEPFTTDDMASAYRHFLRDCVDIAGVFHEFEGALSGKHPFAEGQLKELATTGTWLVQNINPTGGVKAPAARDPAARIRDRFWKLVEDRHDDLRTVGVALFGIKNVDDHVPPLFSRTATPAAKPATPAAKPATPVTPAVSEPAPQDAGP